MTYYQAIKKPKIVPRIFIGSSSESLMIANTVQQLLSNEYDVKIWNQVTTTPGKQHLDSLLTELKKSHFAIFIYNDDDFIFSRNKEGYGPRDNIVLEIGMAMGILGVEKTFIVYDTTKQPKIPTDLMGVSLASYRLQVDGDLSASLGTSCTKIRNAVRRWSDFRNQEEILTGEIKRLKLQIKHAEIPGKRLFTYKDYYPIKLDHEHKPSINPKIYVKALRLFLSEEVNDRLAAMDLIYLRENNLAHIEDFLSTDELKLYHQLLVKYEIDADSFSNKNDISLKNYIRIINNLGDTFKGVNAEFLLHNVRNPIRSIVAARNTEKISGRKIGDPSTRFVYQYVVHQGKTLLQSMEDGSKVAYLKQFKKNKQVKATTIPIHDDKYGLIGIICINIDIDAINNQDSLRQLEFFESYIKNSGYTPLFERDQFK